MVGGELFSWSRRNEYWCRCGRVWRFTGGGEGSVVERNDCEEAVGGIGRGD